MRSLLFLFMVFSFSGAACSAAEPMVISGHPNYPPYMWKQEGKLVGIGVELAKTICRDFRVECDIRPLDSWKRAQELTKTGEIDVLVGAYSNEERRKYMDYTIAYKIDPTQVFVHKEKYFPFSTPEDLKGKKGVAMYGESFGEELDRFIEAELKIDRGYTAKALFENLHAGRVDYILWGYYPWYINALDLDALSWCEALPIPIVQEGMHMIFSKKSEYTHLIERVNVLIRELKKNGMIDKWSVQFMGQIEENQTKGVQ